MNDIQRKLTDMGYGDIAKFDPNGPKVLGAGLIDLPGFQKIGDKLPPKGFTEMEADGATAIDLSRKLTPEQLDQLDVDVRAALANPKLAVSAVTHQDRPHFSPQATTTARPPVDNIG